MKSATYGTAISMLLLLTLGEMGSAATLQVASKRLLSTSGSDRATRYVTSNKIVTLDGVTHVSWLDWFADTTVSSYDSAANGWSGPTTVGTGVDNHAGPALAADSDGYLHAIFGPHAGPFQYKVSALPNDSSSWLTKPNFGTNATYPSFVIDAADTLHLTYRGGSSPHKLIYQRLPKGGAWSAPRVLAQAPLGYSGYTHFHNSMAIGSEGALHLAYDIYYDGPGGSRSTGAGHMMSTDGGGSWQTLEGTALSQPVTPGSNAFFRTSTAQFGVGTNNVAVDSHGNPWISVWDYDNLPYTTSYLYHHDGQQWHSSRVNDLLPEEAAGFRFTSDFAVGLDLDDGIYLAGIMNGNVAVLHGTDVHSPFELIIVDPARPGFSPYGVNIERFVGHNQVDTPWITYSAGPGAIDGVPSDVYAVQLARVDVPRDRTWARTGFGVWSDANSWSPAGVPNGADFTATFGDAIGAASTVIVDSEITVNRIQFDSASSYAIAGTGSITFVGAGASVDSSSGQHQFQVAVRLNADATVDAAGGSLEFNNEIDLAGYSLTTLGPVNINHSIIDSAGGGSIVNSSALGALGTALIAADLVSTGSLNVDISGAGQGDLFSILGAARLEGRVNVDVGDGFIPTSPITILTATAGIHLTGPLFLGGPDAGLFRGLRVVGNELMLTPAVPEPSAVFLAVMACSVWLVRPQRVCAAASNCLSLCTRE